MRVTKMVVVVDEGRHKLGMGNEESRGYLSTINLLPRPRRIGNHGYRVTGKVSRRNELPDSFRDNSRRVKPVQENTLQGG
jgi:hypothetical protein